MCDYFYMNVWCQYSELSPSAWTLDTAKQGLNPKLLTELSVGGTLIMHGCVCVCVCGGRGGVILFQLHVRC